VNTHENQQNDWSEVNQNLSCKTILQEWLSAPTTPKNAWAQMTYAEISKDIWQRHRRKISTASVGIHLPQLAAQQQQKSINGILKIRERVKRRMRRTNAAVDPDVLEQLKHALLEGIPPKVCASHFKLHYNTVLKYQRIFRQQTETTKKSGNF